MKLTVLFDELLLFYGRQNWWPVTDFGKTVPEYKSRTVFSKKQKLEICFGAILTQNTSWKNAEKAIESLNRNKILSIEKISKISEKNLAELVKSSGFFNQKAKRLKIFCKHLEKKHDGNLQKMLELEIPGLRNELLSLNGIGNETADSIILYSAQKPVFVIDSYTGRFVERFFGKKLLEKVSSKTAFGKKLDYIGCQNFFELQLPKNVELFQEFHALIAEHSKTFCKKKPDCSKCFLKKDCFFGLS